MSRDALEAVSLAVWIRCRCAVALYQAALNWPCKQPAITTARRASATLVLPRFALLRPASPCFDRLRQRANSHHGVPTSIVVPTHTMTTFQFRFDRALVVAVLASTASAAFANRALAIKHNCLACHAVDTKLVGPAYRDVAARYEGQSDATDTLVGSIRKGSTGKWGDLAMPAHPKLSQADAKKLATWVLRGAK